MVHRGRKICEIDFSAKKDLFYENNAFYKVWWKVVEIEEIESIGGFIEIFELTFSVREGLFYENNDFSL